MATKREAASAADRRWDEMKKDPRGYARVVKLSRTAVENAAEIVYEAAVERTATALRSRFESGELRGWISGDGDRVESRPKKDKPPLWRIEDECRRRFLKSNKEAAIVLLAAHGPAFDDAANDFDRPEHIAVTAMAQDVLRYAREKGWSKPRKGEEPPFKAQRLAGKEVRS